MTLLLLLPVHRAWFLTPRLLSWAPKRGFRSCDRLFSLAHLGGQITHFWASLYCTVWGS